MKTIHLTRHQVGIIKHALAEAHERQLYADRRQEILALFVLMCGDTDLDAHTTPEAATDYKLAQARVAALA